MQSLNMKFGKHLRKSMILKAWEKNLAALSEVVGRKFP